MSSGEIRTGINNISKRSSDVQNNMEKLMYKVDVDKLKETLTRPMWGDIVDTSMVVVNQVLDLHKTLDNTLDSHVLVPTKLNDVPELIPHFLYVLINKKQLIDFFDVNYTFLS